MAIKFIPPSPAPHEKPQTPNGKFDKTAYQRDYMRKRRAGQQRVYVIGAAEGPFKVGIAANPSRRLASLQTGNPKPLQLYFDMEHPNAPILESHFHAQCKDRQLKGEWFDMEIEEIINTLRTIDIRLDATAQSVTKVPVTIRLDADLADAWKATGKGWQTRLNAALRSVKPFGE